MMKLVDPKTTWSHFPLINSVPLRPDADPVELMLNRTWRPTLTVTGQDGLPKCASGGNVLRPSTTLKLSIRLPPSFPAKEATGRLKKIVDECKPADSKVTFYGSDHCAPGWDAPPLNKWLNASLVSAAQQFFGKDPIFMGEGGSIPFMGMLGDLFPRSQFVVTGVLGPHSNAHGPNEFLNIEYCKKVVCCIAKILEDHCARDRSDDGVGVKDAGGIGHALSRVGGAAEDKLVAEKKTPS